MGTLSGEDIKKLAKLLATTLSFDDLAIFVHASTGDRLFDVFVSKDQPKVPMIVQLLNSLEDLGEHGDLSGLCLCQPARPAGRAGGDYRAVSRGGCRSRQEDRPFRAEGRRPQAEAPTNAAAPGLQRNVRPYLAKLDVLVWQDRVW